MSRFNQVILMPSVLDRLIDLEPDRSVEPDWAQSQSVQELRDAVKRDLESLLNSRQPRPELVESTEEVASSMLTFGLPDFTSMGMSGVDEHQTLRLAVERTIERFERRLRHIEVEVVPPKSSFERKIGRAHV